MEIYHPRDDELLREMRRVRREKKRKRVLWGLLVILVLCALLGWFALNRFFMVALMRGPSMGDTLPEGSLVLVRRLADETPDRGDIVLYETEDGYQIKRIIAKGGDNVVVNPYAGVRVNGAEENGAMLVGRHADAGFTTRRFTVPEGEYFVQGDMLSTSVDSRDREYGTVNRERIIGRAAFVLWPAGWIGEPAGAPQEDEAPETQQGVEE